MLSERLFTPVPEEYHKLITNQIGRAARTHRAGRRAGLRWGIQDRDGRVQRWFGRTGTTNRRILRCCAKLCATRSVPGGLNSNIKAIITLYINIKGSRIQVAQTLRYPLLCGPLDSVFFFSLLKRPFTAIKNPNVLWTGNPILNSPWQ